MVRHLASSPIALLGADRAGYSDVVDLPARRSPAVLLITGAISLATGSRGRRRRQSIQPKQLRHRCRSRTPRAPEPEHESADRRERVAVERPKIDCAARAATGTEHIEPRC